MEYYHSLLVHRRVVLPVTALVDQMLLSMKNKGWGGEDHSALLRVVEDLSQHEILGTD